ncbi:MAG: hypothetical protein ACPGSD_16305 [Flavobacteriales bacterium]
MKYLINLCLLLISLNVFSQTKMKDLIGTWKVQEVVQLELLNFEKPEGFYEKLVVFKTALINSKLVFTENKFDFKLAKDSKGFMTEFVEMMANQPWSLNYQKQEIRVGKNIVNFQIIEKPNGIHFLMSESPFLLKVVKVN